MLGEGLGNEWSTRSHVHRAPRLADNEFPPGNVQKELPPGEHQSGRRP